MPRLHSRLLAVLSGTALALAAAAAPGSATPLDQETSAPADGRPSADTNITLITGDVIRYRPSKDGVPSIGIQEAPRPDGTPVTFATLPGRDGGWLVLPSDAAGMVSAGTLDEKLFDVETLAREERTETIPLLVTYTGEPTASALTKAADALPASENVRPLDSIDGAAMTVKAGQAGEFWAALRADRPAAGRSASGIGKVWLDRRIEVSLDSSVPLVGAPAAWERGFDGKGTKVAVLDTGIDAAHPDFAGKIVASENFSSSPGITDRQGHGTHVASTIAGSGSASGGAYKGVAPGASLLVGKVLADNGNGDWSWAIAGMEWAAEQGADVVNMSLGSCCGNGTDPMSQALDELTKKHGTLFVTAAGNAGDALTVSIPAAAEQALAVGAVDKTTGTTLADFSSRGPRLDDAAVKPNIVAPGVDIVAARSADSTARPIPGNDRYTANSGTSMATPHVAGAAAILAQQHPDWDADELRDALVSTAERHAEHNWFEQGGGRVNVTRAVTQQVIASSAVDFRVLGKDRATRQVTYRNTGDEAVTLAVELVTRGWSGKPAPDGAISLSARSVTIPARGAATVDITVDPAAGPIGAYGGWVTAAAGDLRLVTPFSYYTGPATHRLGISLINSYGTKEFLPGREGTEPLVYAIPLKRANSPEDPFNPYGYYAVRLDFSGDGEMWLPAGDYEIIGVANESRISNRNSWVIEQVRLDGERTVTLDARETVPIKPITREATEGTGHAWYVRTFTDRNNPVSLYGGAVGQDFYVTPVAKVKTGKLRLSHGWDLRRAALASATAGGLSLHPVYDVDAMRTAMTQPRTLPVISVGQGRPQDFDGTDVTGKLALAAVPVAGGESPYVTASLLMEEAARTAARRGAAGFVGYLDVDGGKARVPLGGSASFQSLGLSADEGRDLLAALGGGPVSLRMEPYAGPEVVYRLRYDERGRVPAKAAKVDTGDLARIDSGYHADQPDTFGWEYGESTSGEEPGRITYGSALRMPVARTEYFGPFDDRVTWTRQITNESLLLSSYDRFTGRDRRQSEQWFKAPLVSGAADVPDGYPVVVPCSMCRDGDRFVPAEQWLDSDPRHHSEPSPVTSAPRLFAGEVEIPVKGRYPRSFTVPAEAGGYRLEAVDTSGRKLSAKVTTSSRFASSPPSGTPRDHACSYGPSCAVQPAILLAYDVPLDLLNRAPAGRPFGFEVRAGAHSSIRRAPDVHKVRVEYSVDDGTTWQDARVSGRAGDRFRATVTHPPLDATNGYVSLRVTASDRAGGSVTQTVTRAYALR
ncbi:S8 family serine peptidase [Nonomuraea sp. LPB2021202275-12-8]|uniref:S8 family serine peptidase n=1 Tax=Nonomuraea sp. LPB2021202275-12-8 TaxID=3120159 RepID=UPI00300D3842